MLCTNCGQENPDEAKFCLGCGEVLASERHELRKTVTLLFADVAGSTALSEKVDPETARELMVQFASSARDIVERHGGTVEKFVGDAVMAAFGIPILHEDDAARAVRAAAELRGAVVELGRVAHERYGVHFNARIGVNTGEVIAGDPRVGEQFVSGDPVNVAARLEQNAAPGDILIGASTYALVRDAVTVEELDPLQVKGKSVALTVYRLVDVDVEARGIRRVDDTPLVGRERELAFLREALKGSAARSTPQLITIVGAAGVGKSRLVSEVIAGVGTNARVLQGRCLPYGEGIAFRPVSQMIKSAAEINDDDLVDVGLDKVRALVPTEPDARTVVERIAGLVNLSPVAGEIRETFWSIRKLFASLANDRPLMLVFDDIHWGEPALLELIEYLVDFQEGRVTMVCLTRPDLLEERPDWGSGRPNALELRLSPLDAGGSDELVRSLLDAHDDVPPELVDRVVTTTGGNPLFVLETVRTLVEEGVLQRAEDGWRLVSPVDDLTPPPTISALLSARLDRLGETDRALLQRAAVVGQEFWWGAVADLMPEERRTEVGHILRGLVRKDLIRPAVSTFAGQDAFSFSHILVRDAAYNSLPKQVRSRLHEGFADWLEKNAAARLSEYDEVRAYHLGEAVRYELDLGRAPSERLIDRASSALAAAGVRALDRGDIRAAISLLSQAADVAGSGHPGMLEVLPHLGFAYLRAGNYERALETLSRAVDEARAAGDVRAEALAGVGLVEARLESDHTAAVAEPARRELEHHIRTLESYGPESATELARAWNVVAAAWTLQSTDPEEELRAAERAVDYAQRSGNRLLRAEAMMSLGITMTFGPTPVADVLARCEELRADIEDDLIARAALLGAQGHTLAMIERFDEARRIADEGMRIYTDLGMSVHAAGFTMARGQIELFAQDAAAAEKVFRSGCEILEQMGAHAFLSTEAAMLAEALFRLERLDEAERWTRVAERFGAPDDGATQALYRSVRAKVLARRGAVGEAEALAREALELSHHPSELGEAQLALAEALSAKGDLQGARGAVRSAIEIYERKGNLAALRRARSQLDSLSDVP